ncbi:MAG: alpha/beta hydrolase [Candidatus Liptonbacteria bacterium]|nr:alpha/beta hydrolase [Candidatus Liptonbacteria bacterium]
MEKFGFENEENRRSFEEQFREREAIKTDGGKVDTIDVDLGSPDKVPVLMAPAWGCTMNVYEAAIKQLAEESSEPDDKGNKKEKRRVISLDYARFGGSGTSPAEAVEEYPEEEIRKAKAILGVLKEKGIEKTDAITHSESAINVIMAALVEPEKFRNIVLFAPAGLIGKDTFTRLVKGFSGQFKGRAGVESMSTIPVTETEKKVGAVAGKEGAKYFAKNPLRALKEGVAISNSQIHEALRYLHGKDIGVCVISGVDDPVFPMKRLQKIVKADMLDGFLSVRGGHGAVGEHPEHYIEAAKGMLAAMENKQVKNSLVG